MPETVLVRVISDQDRREDVRYIIAGFLRQEGVSGPEVRHTRTPDSAVYVALAAVVAGDRKFPITVAVEKETQVSGGGA